ncbi:MAG: LD-carboxypeptidase [Bacteroidetes bacterium]|nr:LD-carboxypeptidase [Bacteroidota bacterium]
MIKPPNLQQGDTIGIVSSARKISSQEIQPAIDILEGWGYKVHAGETIGAEHNQFAGGDELRTGDLQKMLDDENIKAILFAKGGYGTVRIVDQLNFEAFVKTPKWIIGYSDITVLHAHIHSNFQIPTIHASMASQLADIEEEARISLQKLLAGEEIEYSFNQHDLNREGNAQGIMVGGNLSLLHTLSGTSSEMDLTGKILFLEDLDEYLYHIDRMMMNLKRAGKLKDLAGLVVGGLTEMNDNDVPYGWSAEEIINHTIADYSYPVCFGFPAGHIKNNTAFILGSEIKLKVSGDGSVLS